ncbi:MAG: helix-turn-helix transcriptional regulator [Herbinix sp.]|jgi:transcriptional regulator with XRE-family HTH domain|nr:helix-turn-helix transcriptional regulator [Herbinix sp.]
MEQRAYVTINLPATGRNIKDLRMKRGLTVKDLQAYFGFEYPQPIYKWQWGECLPTIDNLVGLSVLFQVPIDTILVRNDGNFLLLFIQKFNSI